MAMMTRRIMHGVLCGAKKNDKVGLESVIMIDSSGAMVTPKLFCSSVEVADAGVAKIVNRLIVCGIDVGVRGRR